MVRSPESKWQKWSVSYRVQLQFARSANSDAATSSRCRPYDESESGGGGPSSDRSLLRRVCVTITERLYKGLHRAYHVTCSRLISDWSRTQTQRLPADASLTVGVFVGVADPASYLLFMMKRRRISEQFLIISSDGWVPRLPVENCHWFQAHFKRNEPSAIIQEAWTFPNDDEPIVEHRGMWSIQQGLLLRAKHARGPTSFEGRTLRVGVVKDQQYVNVKIAPNGTVEASGFLGTLLEFLEQKLQFRAELHIPADNKYLSRDNMTQGGLLGMVHQRRLEVGLAPFGIVEKRRPLVDFTAHIESTHHGFLIRNPMLAIPDDEINWRAYLEPFSVFVWLSVLCLGALAWLVMALITWSTAGDDVPLRDSAWAVTSMVLQQGTSTQPSTISGRQSVFWLWMSAILLYTAYTSNIVSLLASDRFVIPFETLEELSMKKDWVIVVRHHAYEYHLLQDIHGLQNHRYLHVEKLEEGVQRVLQGGKYTLFSPYSNINSLVEGDCRLLWTPIKLGYSRGHIILPKHLPYGDQISHAVQVLGEAGLISEIWRKREKEKRQCVASNALPAMSLRHTLPAFTVLLLGLLLALLVLGLEKLARRARGRSVRGRPGQGPSSRSYRLGSPAGRHDDVSFPPIVITSADLEDLERRLSAGVGRHLSAGLESRLSADLQRRLSADLERHLSPGGGGSLGGRVEPRGRLDSGHSSVTDVLVQRTSLTPQQRVDVLVHQRVTSSDDRDDRASAASLPDHPAWSTLFDDVTKPAVGKKTN